MNRISGYADILAEAICYLGYVWAADKFCKKYLGASKKNERLFVSFSFTGWLLLNLANRHWDIPYIFLMMLGHLMFMGLVLLLFQADREKKILAVSILMAAITLGGNFCDSFLSCLALSFGRRVKNPPELFLGRWEIAMIASASLCLVIFAVCWMSKHLASVFYCKPGKWYAILAVPLLLITAVIDMVNWGAANGIMVRSGNDMGAYYDQIFSHAEICVVTGLSMFAAGFYVFGMDRIVLEQEKSSQYQWQIEVYRMLGEQYRQSERLRHDMKNHIIALSGLFRNKEWDKMEDYLKKMEGGCLETAGDITGNKAMDALLYHKRKWAEREGVKWECDIEMPKACHIHEFDLCVLFGNLLDNALEACEKLGHGERRFLNVQAKTVKRCFLIEVRNSMDVTTGHGRGTANKGNPYEHGIGLLNVRDVARRYNGVVHIEEQDGTFAISILMPLSDSAHDAKEVV